MKQRNQRDIWYTEEAGFFSSRYLRDYAEELAEEMSRKQVDFVVKALDLRPGSSVLDLACGHGRHSIELAKLGCQVTGQDLNGYFLRLARAAAIANDLSIDFIQGDMRRIPFRERFDGIVNMFTSFGYLETTEDDQEVLFQAAKSLKRGGMFLLDIQNRERIIRHHQPKSWHVNRDGSVLLLERDLNLSSGIYTDKRTWIERDGRKEHTTLWIQTYTTAELSRMLTSAGFRVLAVYGDYSSISEYNVESPRLIMVAQKK